MRAVREAGEAAFPGKGKSRDTELTALKRELARVKKERDSSARHGHVYRSRTEVKYRAMNRCRFSHPVHLMSRCLHVSPSGYDAWKKRCPSRRAVANAALLGRIRELHETSDGTFGAPRMWEELTFEEIPCSPNRVARLMPQAGLQGISNRRGRGGRRKGSRPPGIEDLLMRDLNADRKNHKGVIDITEIPTGEGKFYVAAVQDLCTKKVPGVVDEQSTGSRPGASDGSDGPLAVEEGDEVILHSDQGSQFTRGDCQRLLKRHNVTCRMRSVGTCADNAAAESFFALLKRDRIRRRRSATRAVTRRDVFDYIERFHNPRMQRRLIRQARKEAVLTQPSTESE